MQKSVSLTVVPLIAVLTAIWLAGNGLTSAQAITVGITVWCAGWWITEPVPIPITSLLPLALFPLLGVLPPAAVAESYGSPLILLLMGGFMLAQSLEKCGVHRRLALYMVHITGGASGRRLVLGFMLAAAVMSMWISNTATTLMLLPVALAVLEQNQDRRLTVPLLLGIAYAASVGGLGTPIGTPPNLIYLAVFRTEFGSEPSFPLWMSWGLPTVILMLPLMALWLTRNLGGCAAPPVARPGAWSVAERRTLAVFALTAFAWITRTAPFGGWREALGLPTANDASVALTAVVLMAVIPDGRGGRLLDWNTAAKIPWGVLILFAGGIAIARAFGETGLTVLVAEEIRVLANLPVWLMIITVALGVTFLTEVTSNTATTSLLMPLLAAAAIAADIRPELLMVPAALSASCAFMLPVATAPNAVVYGSGRLSVKRMAREGLILNLIGAVMITLVCLLRFT